MWHNEADGRTFQLGDGPTREFVKWAPPHPEIDLAGETERMRWAGRWITVPMVLGSGSDGEAAWLHTLGLPGSSAVDARWKGQPVAAARAIGAGLRALHDRLPVDECPYSWSVERRVAALAPEAAAALVADAPEHDRLVVCHGDICVPNTLLADDGSCAGHVDLGDLGVADRWADLAVATYSLEWNYEGDLERELLDAYGIDPDPARTAYYRRLWDAT